MTSLKLLLLALSATIIIYSFTFIKGPDDDVTKNWDDIIWEPVGSLPYSGLAPWKIAIASNGNIWAHNVNELYLSTNNGDTWDKKDNTPFVCGSIVVSPVNGDLFASTEFDGLYKSTDNGKNWENIIENVAIKGILFTTSGKIYLGVRKIYDRTEGACYYSNDNGNTWIEKSNAVPNCFAPSVLGKDGTLYASSFMGIYRSTEGGVTWLPPKTTIMDINSLIICDDGSIFATAYNLGLLKSTDKGVNWKGHVVNTAFDKDIYGVFYNPVTKDIFINRDKFDYPYYHSEVYRSANLGKNWKLENSGLSDIKNKNYGLGFNPNTGQMFMSTLNGIYRTKNYPN
jgi:hypothetical protein